MSNTKTVMSQAANTLTAPLNVEDVFSTYLYEGNSSTQTITNGIDLDGEGGLVWLKERSSADDHKIFDTERGAEQRLSTNTTAAEANDDDELTAFNSDGFSLGPDSNVNDFGVDYASWTFRKAPKFFDVVTYTGTGTARTISHNLGTTPGLIICKGTSTSGNWKVWHRGLSNGASGVLNLNRTEGETSNTTVWNNTLPTDTVFSLGTSTQANESGYEYIAYLFAHNDGDGGFGPNGDADIIKCGSYTGSTAPNRIDVGFEPQFVIVKRTNASGDWHMVDSMIG